MRKLLQAMVAAALLVLPACAVEVEQEVYEPAIEEVGQVTQGDIGDEVLVPELEPVTFELPDLTQDPNTDPGLETPGQQGPEGTWEGAGEVDATTIANLCKKYQGLCEWEEWERIPPR